MARDVPGRAATSHDAVGEGLVLPDDEMHVVPPSWQPLLLAIGLTLLLGGIAVTPLLSALGGALFIAALAHWLTELRRDFHAGDTGSHHDVAEKPTVR